MDRSTADLPVPHQSPELTQAHIRRAGDTIQPACPLALPSVFPNRQVHIREWIQEIVLKPLPGIQGFVKAL